MVYSSRKAAFEEIKKCIPLCANCHRIEHAHEKGINWRNKQV